MQRENYLKVTKRLVVARCVRNVGSGLARLLCCIGGMTYTPERTGALPFGHI